jgi:group II intron reverse transcriptase/maturase
MEAFSPAQAGPLWEALAREENLHQAWRRVEANAGSAGVDGVTVEAFTVSWEHHLQRLAEDLHTWRYRPQPPRWVEVPKRSGGLRRLAVFTVRDRIVQQAVNQVLMPLWDKRFLPCSYAYRPGRSAHQAIAAVEQQVANGRPWVVDADIASFFDSVPHHRFLPALENWLPDPNIRTLVRLSLAAVGDRGLPQGAATSPLFANLYLHPFDQAMVERGYAMHRYADDFVVLCPTRTQAEEALRTAQRLLQALDLQLHAEKTRIVQRDEGFTFLGFTFTAEGKRPSDEAVTSLHERLVQTTDADQRKSIQQGWRAYFGEETSVEADIEQYRRLFIGRPDVYGRYWRNEQGRDGYVPVHRPFGKEELAAHLSGQAVLGTYTPESDSRTRALVFDVDGPAMDAEGRRRAQNVASMVVRMLRAQGVEPLWFDSGGKGGHIWICLTHPAPSQAVRRWAQTVLDRVRPFPDGVMIEVFPKQDYLAEGALGALIRLPLGKHPNTGRPACLLDEHGAAVADPWAVLRQHALTDPKRLEIAAPSPDAPRQTPVAPEAVKPMIEGCALLHGLVEKAVRTAHLAHTERLALLYTLGHCGDAGRAYIHQVIALCSNYNPRITERHIQRLEEGHPAIRCATLKTWLQDYLPGVTCTCPTARKSSSPVDLLKHTKRSAVKRAGASAPSDADWEDIAGDLFDFSSEE